jgi:opacity protein-like surface antigen
MTRLARFAAPVAALLLVSGHAFAQQQRQGGRALDSPRWTYEFRGVYFEPDLEEFATFYGDETDSYLGIAVSYRLRDRLELGGEYGLMKETGVGFLTETGTLGGEVEYRLDPFHVYANWIFQGDAAQRVVPYAGAGLLVMRYEQEVELQPDIEGRTDLGWSARAGVRFQITSHGPTRSASSGSPYWRSYVFLEAQRMSAETDGVDLGGNAVVLGFRMEFNLQ